MKSRIIKSKCNYNCTSFMFDSGTECTRFKGRYLECKFCDKKGNIHEKTESFEVYCHGCNQWLDTGNLIKLGKNGIHCIFCNEHLGYLHDIPKKYRNIINE